MKRKDLISLVTLIICAVFVFNAPLAFAKDMTARDLVEEAREQIVTISIADAKAMFDKGGVIFLDVREPKEYKRGHIPGAISIPRGLLEFKISKEFPDKNASIVVYCRSGARSSLATYALVRMGYKNVKNMDGGWMAWAKAGYPAE
jgi:rhodanese-related sulfurtransferase